MKSTEVLAAGGVLAFFAFLISLVAAWFTHVVYCLMASKYLLLIAGGFIAPIGMIHGYGIWFGMGW